MKYHIDKDGVSRLKKQSVSEGAIQPPVTLRVATTSEVCSHPRLPSPHPEHVVTVVDGNNNVLTFALSECTKHSDMIATGLICEDSVVKINRCRQLAMPKMKTKKDGLHVLSGKTILVTSLSCLGNLKNDMRNIPLDVGSVNKLAVQKSGDVGQFSDYQPVLDIVHVDWSSKNPGRVEFCLSDSTRLIEGMLHDKNSWFFETGLMGKGMSIRLTSYLAISSNPGGVREGNTIYTWGRYETTGYGKSTSDEVIEMPKKWILLYAFSVCNESKQEIVHVNFDSKRFYKLTYSPQNE